MNLSRAASVASSTNSSPISIGNSDQPNEATSSRFDRITSAIDVYRGLENSALLQGNGDNHGVKISEVDHIARTNSNPNRKNFATHRVVDPPFETTKTSVISHHVNSSSRKRRLLQLREKIENELGDLKNDIQDLKSSMSIASEEYDMRGPKRPRGEVSWQSDKNPYRFNPFDDELSEVSNRDRNALFDLDANRAEAVGRWYFPSSPEQFTLSPFSEHKLRTELGEVKESLQSNLDQMNHFESLHSQYQAERDEILQTLESETERLMENPSEPNWVHLSLNRRLLELSKKITNVQVQLQYYSGKYNLNVYFLEYILAKLSLEEARKTLEKAKVNWELLSFSLQLNPNSEEIPVGTTLQRSEIQDSFEKNEESYKTALEIYQGAKEKYEKESQIINLHLTSLQQQIAELTK